MASGRTHATVALIGIGAGLLLATLKSWPIEQVAVGLTAGWLVTPDADVDYASVEELWWDHIPWIGRYIGTVWQMFWLFYARTHAHRGISHWPVIGTAGRVLYIAAWLFGVSALVGACGEISVINWRGIWSFMWPWGFIAWTIQDAGHLVFDYTPILRKL